MGKRGNASLLANYVSSLKPTISNYHIYGTNYFGFAINREGRFLYTCDIL